jgi:hypothetical protein
MPNDLTSSLIIIAGLLLSFKLFMYWPRLFKKKKSDTYPSATVKRMDLDEMEEKIS